MPHQRQKRRTRVIAIVGPTASGKTSLGIELARAVGGEILSADSRQVYRNMDIIAGTPSEREMRAVPHHMLRVADPKRQYSAGTFVAASKKLIDQIAARGQVPIVVGGTGLYAEALLAGWSLPEVVPNMKLRAQLGKKTPPQLWAQLRRLDPGRAAHIEKDNPVRLIRAIEIAKALGSVPPLTRTPPYDVLWIGLAPAADMHTQAIAVRTKLRLRRGMLGEAARLRASLSKKRFLRLGAEFQLLADQLDGKISKKDLAEQLNTWEIAYAKRQMRWHRRNKEIVWISKNAEAERLAKDFLS